MSVTLERSNSGGDHRIEQSGFAHINMAFASPIYNSGSDQRFQSEDQTVSLSSSTSSSIGKNSDDSSGGDGDGEEVQSEFKGGPLDSLDALEEVLPVKRSISNFYCGKSKSFTSLSDAVSFSTIEDITKPENAYTRKRKNLLAFNNFGDKNHYIVRGKGGISKRPINSRSMLSLAGTMNCSEANSGETSNSNSSSSGGRLPPLPPHARRAIQNERSLSPPADNLSPWRSFSLSDLQGAAAAVDESSDPNITG